MPVQTKRLYLQWYRDKGKGQQATDDIPGIIETTCGAWLIAEWECDSQQEARDRWVFLLKRYEINAMTVTECEWIEPPKSKFF